MREVASVNHAVVIDIRNRNITVIPCRRTNEVGKIQMGLFIAILTSEKNSIIRKIHHFITVLLAGNSIIVFLTGKSNY